MTEENVLEGEPQEAFAEGTSQPSEEESVFDEIFGQQEPVLEGPQAGDAQQSVAPLQEQFVPEEQSNPNSDSFKCSRQIIER